jgi:ribosomal protein S2
MAVVTMKQLLDSGVHFGHQTRRWNPKMKRFIFTERNGIYIIDIQQSLSYIDRAYEFVRETVAHGGSVMFVGTKKQAQEAIAEQATRVGMPYVTHRWLGGMLTNFQTVHKRLQRLKELEQIDFTDVPGSGMTKKELLVLEREKIKLDRTLGGIRDMTRVPSAVWIVDTKKEHIAVGEARKLASRSSRSWTPTATPTRSTTRSRATTTRSARSPCSRGSSPTRWPTGSVPVPVPPVATRSPATPRPASRSRTGSRSCCRAT